MRPPGERFEGQGEAVVCGDIAHDAELLGGELRVVDGVRVHGRAQQRTGGAETLHQLELGPCEAEPVLEDLR